MVCLWSLGPVLFLLFDNDLSDNLLPDAKLLVDSYHYHYIIIIIMLLNFNGRITEWASSWKIPFTLDPSELVQEVVFPWRSSKLKYPPFLFNNSTVIKIPVQKHVGLNLDKKLTFKSHINGHVPPGTALWTI